jgi:hypothetical protein
VVAGLFDVAAVLGQGGVVAVFELLGGGQAGLQRCGGQGREERLGAVASMACPPTFMWRAPRPSTSSAEPWQ